MSRKTIKIVYNLVMKIFTIQNLIVLCVMFAVFLVVMIIMISLHLNLLKRIKNMEARNLYLDNTNSYVLNVNDNRERILVSNKPISMYVDPFTSYAKGEQYFDKNLTLKTYVPKKKTFKFKRFIRFLMILVFIASFLTVVFSAILILGDFFHQDIVKLLNMEYTRSFWEYFKNYDLLFGAFLLNVLSFTSIRLMSNTMINYRKYEPMYLKKFNDDEMRKTYSPVYIKLD